MDFEYRDIFVAVKPCLKKLIFTGMMIIALSRIDYPAIIQLWEASVRSSHDFLQEADILHYKNLIYHQYLDEVELFGYVNAAYELQGFIGISAQYVQLLFVHPDFLRSGIGKKLMLFAVKDKGIQYVDVNEQNKKALAFYTGLGFQVIGRSETEGAEKPYPVLRMEGIRGGQV